MKQFNIALVDDHKIFIEGLQKVLEKQPEYNSIEIFLSGRDLIKHLENNPIDLVVSDYSMPSLNGLDLTGIIKEKYPNTKVIILSMHKEIEVIEQVVESNANGYMLKDSSVENLLHGIQRVLNQNDFYCPNTTDLIAENQHRQKENEENKIDLSEREVEILQLLSEELTQKEIGEKLFISEHTVVFHKRKLISKFGVKSTVGLIKKAIEQHIIK